MANNLVILESPGKIGAVKSYLGSNYKVIASVGHVRDLPKSTLGIDIDNGFSAHYINIRGKGDLIKELKKEAKNADKIYLATDPDREGEAISWHLASVLGEYSNKAKRVSFNEITKSAVRDGIKHPRDIDMNIVNSQQARRILDRIVGYKISPILWKTVKSGLSAGRVQSVATKIIVEREQEINSFVPVEYWTISTELKGKNGKTVQAHFYGDTKKKIKIKNKQQVDEILSTIKNNRFNACEVKEGTKHRTPAPPFITSSLLQEASRRYNFQSQRTMKVAQELYEGINLGSEFNGTHGLITYMRTDSLRVSAEAQSNAKDFIISKYGKEYYPPKTRYYKSKGDAQDAHEAIRPSYLEFEPTKIKKALTPDQFKLYKLIWDRFIASQMASAEINTVIADFENKGYIFRSSGYSVKFPGYMAIYEESADETVKNTDDAFDPEKNAKIPEIQKGDNFIISSIEPKQHFTEPPLRYDEATLIDFFKEKGIGRPSTYTPTITVIISRGYVEREGRFLKTTPLVEFTTKIMNSYFTDIMDYKFTAHMEDMLDTIEHGNVSLEEVLSHFYNDFKVELDKAMDTLEKNDVEIPIEQTDIICEKCGKIMVIKNGKFGKFAACPDYPKCKNTKTLNKDGSIKEQPEAKIADFKCELCGSDMIIRQGKFGTFYACSNYPTCKFTKAKTRPTGIMCPKCGKEILEREGKSGKEFYSCSDYPECDFSVWDMPTHRKCPLCGDMLLKKKNKDIYICRNPKCNYKEKSNND